MTKNGTARESPNIPLLLWYFYRGRRKAHEADVLFKSICFLVVDEEAFVGIRA